MSVGDKLLALFNDIYFSSGQLKYKATGLVMNLSANSKNLAEMTRQGTLITSLVTALNSDDSSLEVKANIASVLSNLALLPDAQVCVSQIILFLFLIEFC
jgi:hypothetical protein